MENAWLALDIGCIECGEESAVLGLFATEKEAEAVCIAAEEEQSKNWHGQHDFWSTRLPNFTAEGSQEGGKP
jgi:hypothetical protein